MITERDADIYLLGSGIYSFLDMTLLTQHILMNQCKTLYYLHDLPSLEKYVKKIIPKARNLLPLYYRDGRNRNQIYHDIVDHVVSTKAKLRPVGLLLPGHPLVFSTISQLLISSCKESGLRLEIVPGISALDRMCVNLKLDIATDGVQIFNAATAVIQNIQLNPNVGCFLFQVGSFNHIAARNEVALEEEVRRLQEYLLQFYPVGHKAKIVECSVEVGFADRVTDIVLGDLEKVRDVFDYNATMYLPPLPA